MKALLIMLMIALVACQVQAATSLKFIAVIPGMDSAIVQFIPNVSSSYVFNLTGMYAVSGQASGAIPFVELQLAGLRSNRTYSYNLTFCSLGQCNSTKGSFSTPISISHSSLQWRIDGNSGTATLTGKPLRLQRYFPQLQYSFIYRGQAYSLAGLAIQGTPSSPELPSRLSVDFDKDIRLEMANNQSSYSALHSARLICWMKGNVPVVMQSSTVRLYLDRLKARVTISGGEDTLCPFTASMPVKLSQQ